MKKFLLMIALAVLHFATAVAQIQSVHFSDKDAVRYKRLDFLVSLKSVWQNPYLQEDIKLDMEVTTPSGARILQPCFFETGKSGEISAWAARFLPQDFGVYHFHFVLQRRQKVISRSKTLKVDVKNAMDKGFLTVKNNWALVFDNGEPFRGVAENICWESRTRDDSKYFAPLHQRADRYNYDYMLPKFARYGGNFFRTWICAWNLPLDFQDGFNNHRYRADSAYFNPSAIERMDHLLALADSLDLYMMLTLGTGNFRKDGFGGVATSDEFFANPIAKRVYKNRLRYIVARWAYSPHIAMWELLNEVDNIQHNGRDRPIDSQDIVDWHSEMADYLKEIDPYRHLVTSSISHRDIQGLNDVEGIDINQKHIYGNTAAIPSEVLRYANDHGKPYVIGEFGYEWDWHKNFDDFSREMEVDFKRGLWYGLFSPTPVLPMSWWWEYFENRSLMPYYLGVREINDRMLKAGKGEFKRLEIMSNELDAYAVQCGMEVFVYIHNAGYLIQGGEISIAVDSDSFDRMICYDPVERVYSSEEQISCSQGRIVLKDVYIGSKSDMVFIIK
ncbi:cellulase family glycosylhydrolase [Sphingobacterium griseoflavum]|nr:cellulase family glycosylhydrolase [Sphingobacterium griseoflavum]